MEPEELLRLNSVCPYYTMFPLAFPYRKLRSARRGEWVLDPFCGRGTTTFAARLRGLPSVGIDSNPVAAAIAEAKLAQASPAEVVGECSRILTTSMEPTLPIGDFWDWAYHPGTLSDLCMLREALVSSCTSNRRILLRALLLGVLHGPRMHGEPSYLSNQMPRTYATKPGAAVRYWRRHRMRPRYVSLLEVVARRAHRSLVSLPPPRRGRIIAGDTTKVLSRFRAQRFDWIITSPPYPGMRSYRPDQWLRDWFLGGDGSVPYGNNGQLGRYTGEAFVEGLSAVWSEVARVSKRGAKLIVRFGTLPSIEDRPSALLRRSLTASHAGWRVTSVIPAGVSPSGRRQATQFGRDLGDAIEEVDLTAVLEV